VSPAGAIPASTSPSLTARGTLGATATHPLLAWRSLAKSSRMIQVIRATANDCARLAELSKAAFTDDLDYGSRGHPYPCGYESERWHALALRWGCVVRLVRRGETIGGAIVIRNGSGWLELARLWLAPEAQGMGLGREAVWAIEEKARPGVRWTVDTPAWAKRAVHFFPQCGYGRAGRADGAILFAKISATVSLCQASELSLVSMLTPDAS